MVVGLRKMIILVVGKLEMVENLDKGVVVGL